MDRRFDTKSSTHRWIIFVCGVICIAAVGISSRFVDLRREEKERRLAAERRLNDVTSQLQLLREKNRELAEQLREAKRIAEEFVREREQLETEPVETATKPQQPEVEPSPKETVPSPEEKESRLVKALEFFSLKRISAGMSKAGGATQAGWDEVRAVFAESLPLSDPGSDPEVERGPSELLAAIKSFPVDRLLDLAASTGVSAEEAFSALREQLASKVAASKPVEAPAATSPPESLSDATKKLTATNEELREELADVRQEKRELERRIAERTGEIPGSVNVGQVKITTGRRFSGRVLVVNHDHNFVVIDIGKIHGLEKGVVLIVHRGNKFIGKAQVMKVYEKMAAADLVVDWMQDDVKVSDGVKKF